MSASIPACPNPKVASRMLNYEVSQFNYRNTTWMFITFCKLRTAGFLSYEKAPVRLSPKSSSCRRSHQNLSATLTYCCKDITLPV